MKAVILDGTHNKKGMTSVLLESFLEGFAEKASSAEIVRYDLMDSDIGFCLWCNRCIDDKNPRGARCSIEDGFERIRQDCIEADMIVFVTPIYEYTVSSSMKRFLERCLTMAAFRFGVVPRMSGIRGKQGIVLLSSGAPFPFNHLMGITRHPKFLLRLSCKLFGCSELHFICAGGMRINDKMKAKWENKSKMLGVEVGSVMKCA